MSHHNTSTTAPAQERILAALIEHGHATARDIAGHTGLAYSTVTAGLRKLAAAGHAAGSRPDEGPMTWRPATGGGPAGNDSTPQQPLEAASTPSHTTMAVAAADDTDTAIPQTDETAVTPAADDGEAAADTSQPAVSGAVDPPAAADAGRTTPTGTDSARSHTGGGAAGADEPRDVPRQRRGRGQLRAQVLGVLQNNPDQAFTPHQLSKHLDGASSGAIVLAARKLVIEGSVREVRQAPATFQAE